MNDQIVEIIKKRLDVGAKKYGEELNVNDGREWLQETLEELLDGCVYLSANILKLKQETCEHKNRYYQEFESETNIPEAFTCEDCGSELPIPLPDWDLIAKDDI